MKLLRDLQTAAEGKELGYLPVMFGLVAVNG